MKTDFQIFSTLPIALLGQSPSRTTYIIIFWHFQFELPENGREIIFI